MLYAPPPPLGLALLRVEPTMVTVLSIDEGRGLAWVRAPVAAQSIVNILRKRDGNPPLEFIERYVLLKNLKELQ